MKSFFRSRENTPSNTGHGKVVALLNQKGGVGKTTLAFNTAHALAHQGHRVLCLDMDPQANLSMLLGFTAKDDEQKHIFHLLLNSIRELKALHTPIVFSDVVESCYDDPNGGVIDLLSSGQELSGFELSVAGISAPRQLVLKKFLEKNNLLDDYDYVIIDGPPTLGLLVVNILCAAHGVLVPFLPDQFSRKGLEHFHHVVEDIEDMGITNPPKILGYIPNLLENRRKQAQSDYDLICKDLEQQAPIFSGFSNRVQLVKSSAQKRSVFSYKSMEYRQLQDQFLEMAQHIDAGLRE